LDRFDALASCFPAGTVTGAPKIRAMQIIDELEPSKRGVYAGSVLYVDYADNLDSCIAIRTITLAMGSRPFRRAPASWLIRCPSGSTRNVSTKHALFFAQSRWPKKDYDS
jgi:hypothetical protein